MATRAGRSLAHTLGEAGGKAVTRRLTQTTRTVRPIELPEPPNARLKVMLLRVASLFEYLSRSICRLVPLAILIGLVMNARIVERTRPLMISAPRAMMRSGLAVNLAREFTKDTGISVLISDYRVGHDRPAPGELVAFEHGRVPSEAFRAGRTREVLRSAFLLVGPPADPADVRDAHSAGDAIRRIWSARAAFRPAPDGTAAAVVEQHLWDRVKLPGPAFRPSDPMRSALAAASATGAYMIVDRLSFDSLRTGLDLLPLYSGGRDLQDE